VSTRLDELFKVLPFSKPELVPGGYPVELFAQPGGILRIGEMLQQGAHELMRLGRGGMNCTVYLFCQRHVITGEPGDALFQLQLKTEAHDDPDAKEMFSRFVRGAARFGQARGVSIMMEAWMLRTAERPTGSIANHPERTEIVMLRLETKPETRVWMAPITRYGRHKYSLGDFVEVPSKGEGMFVGLMSAEGGG